LFKSRFLIWFLPNTSLGFLVHFLSASQICKPFFRFAIGLCPPDDFVDSQLVFRPRFADGSGHRSAMVSAIHCGHSSNLQFPYAHLACATFSHPMATHDAESLLREVKLADSRPNGSAALDEPQSN
jgi:hypothetical protein